MGGGWFWSQSLLENKFPITQARRISHGSFFCLHRIKHVNAVLVAPGICSSLVSLTRCLYVSQRKMSWSQSKAATKVRLVQQPEEKKIKLACISTPEFQDNPANPLEAKTTRDYLNGLVARERISIRLIAQDRYGSPLQNFPRIQSIFRKDWYLKAMRKSISIF